MDVTPGYLRSLTNKAPFLRNVSEKISEDDQRSYISGIADSPGDVIFGLYYQGILVGTAGVQISYSNAFLANIDVRDSLKEVDALDRSLATIGIFVLNNYDRGKGLGKSLIWSSSKLYASATNMDLFGTEVDENNLPSISAFEGCGFRRTNSQVDRNVRLFQFARRIKRPTGIREIEEVSG